MPRHSRCRNIHLVGLKLSASAVVLWTSIREATSAAPGFRLLPSATLLMLNWPAAVLASFCLRPRCARPAPRASLQLVACGQATGSLLQFKQDCARLCPVLGGAVVSIQHAAHLLVGRRRQAMV